MPLIVVAKNLGHSTTRMVEKHYSHLAASYICETVRAYAPRFGRFVAITRGPRGEPALSCYRHSRPAATRARCQAAVEPAAMGTGG